MNNSICLLDEFVSTVPGDAIRLFPFGKIVKNGETIDITPEFAKSIKLPHFKPPIKLGSHKDETKAGGHITDIFIGPDGLYGRPVYNDNGTTAITEGHYKYHSPELLTHGGYEDPETGEIIQAPILAGLALLHRPHLGDKTALYQVTEVQNMTDERVEMASVPVTFFDSILNLFKRDEEPEPTPEPEPQVNEEFEAIVQERDEYKAKLQEFEAEQKAQERVANFEAAIQEKEIKLGVEDAGKMLASMTDEQAEWVITRFGALQAQINESALFDEKGDEGEGEINDREALNKAILSYAAENKLSYNEARIKLAQEKPELFEV